MRSMIIHLLFIIFPTVLIAQIQQGKITYSVSVDFNLPEDVDPSVRAMLENMPRQLGSQAQLIFNQEASRYETVPAEEKRMESSDGANQVSVRVMGQGSSEIYYTQLVENQIVYQQNIFDRSFLIEDELQALDWQLEEVNGTDKATALPTKQAIAITASGDTVVAQYTPAIPIGIGPTEFGGLPGAIIQLKVGNRTYQATALEVLPEKPTILPPTEGKKMTKAKFEALREKKMNEFSGGQGARVIRIGGE
ncbi:MAG: GLPGLI family protein [Bacteroidota bacterium]